MPCGSRDHLHLWPRRRFGDVHVAPQRAAQHQGGPAGAGLQHAAETRRAAASGQRLWPGRLPAAADSKSPPPPAPPSEKRQRSLLQLFLQFQVSPLAAAKGGQLTDFRTTRNPDGLTRRSVVPRRTKATSGWSSTWAPTTSTSRRAPSSSTTGSTTSSASPAAGATPPCSWMSCPS